MNIEQHENEWLKSEGSKMITALGVKSGNKVVEFGCGIGRYGIPVSQVVGENGSVFAIERDKDEIAIFRERMALYGGGGIIKIMNGDDILLSNIETGIIDSMFMFDVLQYVDDWSLLFESARRVLKSNGTVHVYPAEVPHPGSVDPVKVALQMQKIGFQYKGKLKFDMMHNKDMVTDYVYTFVI
ncbi:MAG: class I SAM-dependent methyltransferase [Deltaproteobacteria bacterium]|nr:class I SAM-dependent methyltransferase [Deltaproteobacteria bacterium]